jgi:general secretion pathway protein F
MWGKAMGIFHYTAVKATGERLSGSIEAGSPEEAKKTLRDSQVIILSLSESKKSAQKTLSMSFDQRVIFTSQLAQLLEADVPLYESLEALEEQSKGESHQPVIQSLREQIRRGSFFSKALESYPAIFSPLYRAVVTAGESVGHLDQALSRLSQLFIKERTTRQKLVSSLMYPVLLFFLLIAAIGVLLFYVIPAIEDLFEGKSLPGYTAFIIALSHFARSYFYYILAVLLGGSGFAAYKLSKPQVRKWWVEKMLHWPVIGPFLLKISLARFARTLSNLLSGGTPLSTALVHAKEALGNSVLEAEIERALQEIIDGGRFSSSLHASPYIPPLFSKMVGIGEETGRLAPILANLTHLYEEDSERLLERSVSLIQPILLIAMGLIIGSTLLAILLPLANFSAVMGE